MIQVNPLESWTPSTDWREGFSDGQSPTPSIAPWDRSPSETIEKEVVGTLQPYPGEHLQTTGSHTVILTMSGRTALERWAGCAMMAMMPEQGLEEALYSLWDMLEFYRTQPPEPAVRQPQLMEGTIVEERNRPGLIITE